MKLIAPSRALQSHHHTHHCWHYNEFSFQQLNITRVNTSGSLDHRRTPTCSLMRGYNTWIKVCGCRVVKLNFRFHVQKQSVAQLVLTPEMSDSRMDCPFNPSSCSVLLNPEIIQDQQRALVCTFPVPALVKTSGHECDTAGRCTYVDIIRKRFSAWESAEKSPAAWG